MYDRDENESPRLFYMNKHILATCSMGILRNVALVVLAISFTTFVALFGRLPALRNSPIGLLYRGLCVHLPNRLQDADRWLTGGKVFAHGSRVGNYLLFEKHPLILLFFLLLLTSATVTFLTGAWTRISVTHRILAVILVPLPYLFTHLCAASTGSFITSSNHEQLVDLYPFDHTTYHPNKLCHTCKFVKPARSKHCSLCGHCVARADHHCAWVNNCLGKENYRWFLCLMASLGVVQIYGAMLARSILAATIADNLVADEAFAKQVSDAKTYFESFVELMQLWSDAMSDDVRIGATGLLALLTFPLVWGLLLYHVYLVWAGMTTNETAKWAALRDDMFDGYVWKGKKTVVLGNESGTTQDLNPRQAFTNEYGMVDELESDSVNLREWPVEVDQIVLRTNDGKPPYFPNRSHPLTQRATNQDFWERCYHLGQVENIYDLGFLDNLADVFFPNWRYL